MREIKLPYVNKIIVLLLSAGVNRVPSLPVDSAAPVNKWAIGAALVYVFQIK